MPRLTVAQAVVAFLARQFSERDGRRQRLIPACFGIFGHGNVAGLGEALATAGADLPYHLCRTEQGMVHTAAAYARMTDRLSTLACTTSIGPGATNLVTGAAGATINRLPVLLLPGDLFATRVANPVLQELEDPRSHDVSVTDALRPVSRYWDRINRPEQLPAALLAAMRVLTDPAETGAVTLALPQDVQAEAYDWPDELFAERVWHVPRPRADEAALIRAADIVRAARRPLLVAGGGVIYSGATGALRRFAEEHGVPVAESQAGTGALPHGHPLALGAIGVTGTTAANEIAAGADVVIGVGTRYSDFTTASGTLFGDGARFVNLNVTRFDAAKLSGTQVVGDARESLTALDGACAGWGTEPAYRESVARLRERWTAVADSARHADPDAPPTQTAVIGAVNDAAGPRGVVVCAAGSMPGDLHRLWRSRDPKSYHVEYGYSCMGYEIAGGIGVKLAAPEREVFVLVGDGSYLMLPSELATAVAEGVKLVVVLVDNAGFASIGRLSESVGAHRLGTAYVDRTGEPLPIDLGANAASLGADLIRVSTMEELRAALATATAATRTTVVHVRTDRFEAGPDAGAWWDVPVAEVSTTDQGRAARAAYEAGRKTRRTHLRPG
ncbi:3D-(3,5/4)-trihydroxycyclohexane-1,2-dione acylhydrolase (decyclizing) [Micromonospora chaiyaphumensis]|uniref:3D-(3,5/4)-trihydroxycyclohexane-1,2-dione acylhydrolase (Decyclizing) n=1 Tax=Micromonospora chaiyaphumensis TaxID=307119 RepID=A0A1C4X1S0_9ACTN|nr:3D-(3,5/4)-trihydroxycyclohexane-1,2-dione acylhydrolase (decyclizing) [Micromonospora chaiyaphumensis]SCF02415.1 3D-(3,5/4)-trihydroxycyclohexane-1,2-dione acylhydrolase (decyclizing) [Micromonospora chaiyaphumensis]